MRFVTRHISLILDGAYSKPKPKYYSQGGVVNLNLYILDGVVNLNLFTIV